MKNFYGTQYILIGLSIISLSLSGMRTDNDQLREADHVITFKPQGNYIKVTKQNRPQFEQYFNQFGIDLKKTVNKVISVQLINQTNKENQLIPANSTKYITNTPLFLSLDTFTKNQKVISNNNNIVIQFRANAYKSEDSFKATQSLDSTTKENIEKMLNSNLLPQFEEKYHQLKIAAKFENYTADKLFKYEYSLDTNSSLILTKKADLENSLSVDDLFLIHDFLTTNATTDSMIKNNNISEPVKAIVNACTVFEKIIAKNKEYAKILEPKKKPEEKDIAEEIKKEHNSLPARLMRAFIYCKKNALFITICSICLLYRLKLYLQPSPLIS